jgi:hypothetical protein
MSDPTQMGVPAAAPAPLAAPVAPPAKKKSRAGTIITWIIVVLVLLGTAYWKFAIPAMEDAKFKVGACLDVSTQGDDAEVSPKVVDCASSTAHSKIIAVFSGKTNADAASVCPDSYEASLEYKNKLFCLAGK